ncbi:hypothetical protein [Bradyrhizobium sp. Ec3.3]|uniref:hypothetical protein n=1 Tax=Bradyrhizobium sp. Ec3.3 TaxID=189753 RepID=UPI0004890B07|nr:hypothetical protein [Bradyrhizobium sp. Ec3.3]
MLLSVFGTPSALMYGGLNVVRNLTEIVLGPYQLANANSTEQLRERLSGLGPIHDAKVVFYSDLPDPDLCALFVKTRAPIVLFVDNFDDVVAYARRSRDMTLNDSIRLASRSFCALEPLIRSDLVLKLDARTHVRALGEVLADIAAFFGARLNQAKREEVARSLSSEGEKASLFAYLAKVLPHAALPGKAIQQMAIADRTLVAQLSQPYSAIVSGRQLEHMDWPISFFMDSAAPDSLFSGRVELLGPARFLAYGPYLHLTPGKWCVDVVLEVQENHSGNQLYADIYSGDILSVVTTSLPASGTYRLQISFEITNPLEPVQVRFQTLSGAIEGIITFNRIAVRRAGPVLPDLRREGAV